MATIINTTYFDGGKFNIPSTNTAAVRENVTSIIEEREPEYLQGVLGYPLWKLFDAQLPTPADERFQYLLNGAEFTDACGKTKKWTGLKVIPKNPIRAYVMYWYLVGNVSFTTPMGQKIGKAENATSTSSVNQQVMAYNEMVDVTCLLCEFLTANAEDYPEFDLKQVKYFEKINQFNL